MDDKIKILIVDDLENNRYQLRDIIQEMGYMPILAADGEQALKMLQRVSVHLILLDVAMPVMDGYETCKIIKSKPMLRDIPILFISAYDEPSDIVKGFEMGGSDYITKPFIREVIRARINSHVKSFEEAREAYDTQQKLHASLTNQMDQIEMERKNVIYAIVKLIRKSPWFKQKEADRLSANCQTMAEALQLSNEYGKYISDSFVERMEVVCMMKHMGFLAIDTGIINKKDRTPAEEEEYRRHTTIALEVLDGVKRYTNHNEAVDMAYDIAGYHHENYDGTGYPEGRKGDEIPLAAQIVRLIHDFDKLTEGLNVEGAMEVLEQHAGKEYNPVLVTILARIAKILE